MIVDEETYVEHAGVKGMKWGVRKQRRSAARSAEAARVSKLTPAEKRAEGRASAQKRAQRARTIQKTVAVAAGALWVAAIFNESRRAPLSTKTTLSAKPASSSHVKTATHRINPNAKMALMRQEATRNAEYQARMRGAREVKDYLRRTGQEFL